ncbi:hypothetical protein Vretimale_786 [Volvox reticuliferus]|uniref:Uncharacterized protein n=1 Tax=Volvox reticuliferus TaxID=1737510 RepID=A0A8J4D698_9CHLO|nr:hypothetical protein Vretifemale_2080 [Volvox reticuliferus]GIL94560.1 hypothetical protein Vretimale_786 [Volvox reticuliferus]
MYMADVHGGGAILVGDDADCTLWPAAAAAGSCTPSFGEVRNEQPVDRRTFLYGTPTAPEIVLAADPLPLMSLLVHLLFLLMRGHIHAHIHIGCCCRGIE